MAPRLSNCDYRRWERDRKLLGAVEPGLRLEVDTRAGRARIVGTISVPRLDGRTSSFEIVIKYPGLDPRTLPDTYDRVGRFPPGPDRHIESDRRFCLWVPEAAPVREFRKEGGLTLYLFRVQEFLGLQLMYEVRQKHNVEPNWPGDAWGHGNAGHQEWIDQTTSQLTPNQLQRLLGEVSYPGRPGRRCPCGSGRRLGNCHKQWLTDVRKSWADRPSARLTAYRVLKERRANLPTR